MASYPQLASEFATDADFFRSIVGREATETISLGEIHRIFSNKKVLITGAGGTIGSALSRRLIQAGVKNTYLLDRDESSLHALALKMSNSAASHSEKCIIADIRDSVGISSVIQAIKPDYVLHAAALKHLVVLEKFPREGYLTNVLGTINLVQACADAGVEKFINVSTDKAANPTSVLGATKRIGELLTYDESFESKGTWSSVRFGNVFASRGSVIETFIHQIQNELPITLTHKDVTRFFMSHDEAANLILASASNKQSAIYIQEMGEKVPIRNVILNLANTLGKSAKIEIIGLQKGEKLHEELYDGPVVPTNFPSIVCVKPTNFLRLSHLISKLSSPNDHAEARAFISQILKSAGGNFMESPTEN
jgi:FlaA1/EpsC-like NDP-sugar epimerase